MTRNSKFRRTAPLVATVAAAALVLSASHADAQYGNRRVTSTNSSGETEVYEWQGQIDKEVDVRLRGSRATVQGVGVADQRAGSGRVYGGLPQQEGTIRLEMLQGRGMVTVLQQPSAQNGYTAVIRMVDGASGAGSYRVAAYFQPAYTNGNGGYNGNSGYGNNGGYNGTTGSRDDNRANGDRGNQNRGNDNSANDNRSSDNRTSDTRASDNRTSTTRAEDRRQAAARTKRQREDDSTRARRNDRRPNQDR